MVTPVFAGVESEGSARGADVIGAVISFGGEQFGSVELTTNEAETGGAITANTPTSNCYFDECTFVNNMADIASGSIIGH